MLEKGVYVHTFVEKERNVIGLEDLRARAGQDNAVELGAR